MPVFGMNKHSPIRMHLIRKKTFGVKVLCKQNTKKRRELFNRGLCEQYKVTGLWRFTSAEKNQL